MTQLTNDEQDERIKKAEREFTESIEHIDEASIKEAAATGQAKVERLEDDIPERLEAVWNDLKTCVAMLKDYVTGAYRDIPFGSISAIACAVLYFVSPIDAIPDFIPIIGYIDDAAVFVLCAAMVQKDIEKYIDWKSARD